MLARLFLILCVTTSISAYSEDRRTVGVLFTTDSSGLALAERVQSMLDLAFNRTGRFQSSSHSITLAGYSEDAVTSAFNQTGTQLLSFAYIDKERIALFLFDTHRPGKYLATSETMAGSPTNRLTDDWLQNRLDKVFAELLKQYALAAFEDVPLVQNEEKKEPTPEESRDERGRRLFKELSKLQDGSVYVGANLGMARFSAQGASASVVSIGGYLGVKLYERLRLEAGADIFSYLLLHLDTRVQLPIAERYVSLSLGMGVNQIAAVVTQNRGFNPTFLRTGALLYGPSLSFDVPLLGASVRGDIRVLLGEATVIMGTYGLAYAL